MKPVGWWIIGLLMGALTTWLGVSSWIGREQAKTARWVDSTKVEAQARFDASGRIAAAAFARAELHRVASEAAADRAAKSDAMAARARQVTADLRSDLAQALTGADSIPWLVAALASQEETIEHLTKTKADLKASRDEQVQRSAALTDIIKADTVGIQDRDKRIAELEAKVAGALPTPRGTKLFGLIPRPSREITFVIGLVVGVAATR